MRQARRNIRVYNQVINLLLCKGIWPPGSGRGVVGILSTRTEEYTARPRSSRRVVVGSSNRNLCEITPRKSARRKSEAGENVARTDWSAIQACNLLRADLDRPLLN